MMRIGQGLDVHAFDPDGDAPLILAGVEIPGVPGLSGHSDADVVAHAVMDALLGAAGTGDLGTRFGTDDPGLAGADSVELLADLAAELAATGWTVTNLDVTVVAQTPRVSRHRTAMVDRLRAAVGSGAVSVKATTTDGLGAIGAGDGIACLAVCLLEKGAGASQ